MKITPETHPHEFIKIEIGEQVPLKGAWWRVLRVDAAGGRILLGMVGPTGQDKKRRGKK
jgi:hypothetical protein